MKLLNTSCFSRLASIVILLVLGSYTTQAYRTWNPEDYYGIPARDKQIIFFDEFDDNRYNWDMGALYLREKIQDGEFHCETLTTHPYTKRRTINLKETANYEVEVRIRFVSLKGSKTSMTGLTFGRDLRGNEYNFFFSSERSVRVSKFDKGRTQQLLPIKYVKSLSRYSFNTLMVRRVGDKWFFFVNEELIAEMQARPLFGNDFGFTIGGNMEVEVDYLRVAEIEAQDHTGPTITLIEPQLRDGETGQFIQARQIIRGRINDISGVSGILINNQSFTVNKDGVFAVSLTLQNPITPITIEAIDRYDNSTFHKFFMEYEPNPQPRPSFSPITSTASQDYQKQAYGTRETNDGIIKTPGTQGQNYLLLIGVNEYSNWNRLHNAVKDCKDISYILTNYYQFEKENVITLFDREATRENILETFESLQERLNENDNLLIYYAGHGYYDDRASLGYWVPVNARLNKIPDFIRNSTIHDYLRTINTKHTLLIADACYAGSLFSNTRGVLNEDNRSRWAFTSGNIEKVWDGQPGQNSPFARYLIRILRNNTQPTLRANELILEVGDLVQRNTAQTPKGSALKNVGDLGGVFTFQRRR
jgi:hypothetical protein